MNINNIDISELKAYIDALTPTERVLLRRKLLGIKRCPKRVKTISTELPEELEVKKFKAALKPEESRLINKYEELKTLAATARFNFNRRGK